VGLFLVLLFSFALLLLPKNLFTFKPVTKKRNRLNEYHNSKQEIRPSAFQSNMEILGDFIADKGVGVICYRQSIRQYDIR
jgi:hypothetical protein